MAEASYRLTAPMKFTVSVEDGRQEPGKPLHSFGRIGAQYTTPSLAVDADVDVVNGPTIRTSALLRKYSVLLGFDLQYNTHFEDKSMTPEVLDVNIGLGYEGRGWHFAAKTMEMLSSLRVGYFHKVNQDVTAGFMVDYRLRTNYQKIVLGAKWRYVCICVHYIHILILIILYIYSTTLLLLLLLITGWTRRRS